MKQKTIKDTIELFEKSLIEYKEQLDKNPESIFYKGLVKNTEEFIEELKEIIKR